LPETLWNCSQKSHECIRRAAGCDWPAACAAPELNFPFPNPRQSPQSAKGESCAPRRDVKYAPEAHLFLASSKGLLDPP
jgi:hypothetical protein